jgi:hypothetical protein
VVIKLRSMMVADFKPVRGNLGRATVALVDQ